MPPNLTKQAQKLMRYLIELTRITSLIKQIVQMEYIELSNNNKLNIYQLHFYLDIYNLINS